MAKQQRGFEDLDCYQLALQVLKEAYKVANRLPTVERYNLADQMRRAATSVTLNIAEGYGRYHYLDKLRFFYIVRGSLDETLSGYIRFVHRQRQGHKEYGERVLQEPRTEYIIRPTPEPPNPESTLPEFTNPE